MSITICPKSPKKWNLKLVLKTTKQCLIELLIMKIPQSLANRQWSLNFGNYTQWCETKMWRNHWWKQRVVPQKIWKWKTHPIQQTPEMVLRIKRREKTILETRWFWITEEKIDMHVLSYKMICQLHKNTLKPINNQIKSVVNTFINFQSLFDHLRKRRSSPRSSIFSVIPFWMGTS